MTSIRYHALDGLRAIMMLLGLVLHSAVSYGAAPQGEAWPYKDLQTSGLLDVLVYFIHIFRMPIFFVMAGFFAALLIARRGIGGLLVNRTRRILVPFLIGWILLTPLTILGFVFANEARDGNLAAGWDAVVGIAAGFAFFGDTTIHLWFLYYLMLFYGLVLVLGPLILRLPVRARRLPVRVFAAVNRSFWRVPLFSALTIPCLLAMPIGILHTSTTFLPDPRTFVSYGVFFVFGILLYPCREDLETFKRRAWTKVGLATLLVPANLVGLAVRMGEESELHGIAHVVIAVTGAAIVWLFVYGITGLFLRYLNQRSAKLRYLTDASYWIYLAHLPFTIWLPGLLSHLEWPALVKFAVVLFAMTPVLLLTYDLLVRSTWIGRLLNGRRYESVLRVSVVSVPRPE